MSSSSHLLLPPNHSSTPGVFYTGENSRTRDKHDEGRSQSPADGESSLYVKVSLLQKEDSYAIVLVKYDTSLQDIRDFLCNAENWQYLSDLSNVSKQPTRPSVLHSNPKDKDIASPRGIIGAPEKREPPLCPVSYSPHFFSDLRSFLDLATPWNKDGGIGTDSGYSDLSSSDEWNDAFPVEENENRVSEPDSFDFSDWDSSSDGQKPLMVDDPSSISDSPKLSKSSLSSSSPSPASKLSNDSPDLSWSSDLPVFVPKKSPREVGDRQEKDPDSKAITSRLKLPKQEKAASHDKSNVANSTSLDHSKLQLKKSDACPIRNLQHCRKQSNITKAVLESICIAREKHGSHQGKSDFVPINLTTKPTIHEIFSESQENGEQNPFRIFLYLSVEVQGERRAAWDDVISLDSQIVDYMSFLLRSPAAGGTTSSTRSPTMPNTGRGASGILNVGPTPWPDMLNANSSTQISVRDITKKLRDTVCCHITPLIIFLVQKYGTGSSTNDLISRFFPFYE